MSTGRTLVCLTFLLATPPLAAFAREATNDSGKVEHLVSGRSVSIGFQDFTHVISAPARWHGREWGEFGIVSGAVAGSAMLLDVPVRNFSQRNRSRLSNNIARDFKQFGSYYPFAIEAGFYFGGEIFRNENAKACGLDALSAGIISVGLIEQPVKWLIGRNRPYQNNGRYSFDPFTFDASFPSGHTTHAFMLATVISMHYPKTWVKVTGYSVATLVAFDRINDDIHFTSDVITGAVIGVVVGRAVVFLNRKLRKL